MSDEAAGKESAGRKDDAGGVHAPPPVVVEERGPHAVIRLARPEQRNPLSSPTLDELEAAFSSLAARGDVTTIIFTGARDVFASGADIRELQTLTPDSALEFARRGQRLFRLIEGASQLTVAAVNGYCMGGGLDLALACRVRVASFGAVFAHPGARLGIITGWGGTQRLPRLVGAPLALEMFATARRLDAREALAVGLVSRLHEDALACALDLAARRDSSSSR